jgi:outer membrane protein TolC
MKTTPVLIVLLLAASTAATLASFAQATNNQANNKLLEVALERSVPYQLTRSDQREANEKLERIKSDPLAIKPELLEAQLTAELAKLNLTASLLEVRKALSKEFYAWLEAKDSLALAKLKSALSEANLAAARVRFKSGAINQLEVAKVEADAKSASIDQENADSDLESAANALTIRLGKLPAANTTLEVNPKPQRANLEAALGSHPKVVEARGRLDKAKLDLDIKDNEFSASVDIANAKTVLNNAQKAFEDSKSLIKTALANAWDSYVNAGKSVPVRERSRAVAKDDRDAQQARFSKGLVSKLAVQQSQLSYGLAELALEQAQHRLALSVIELASSANLDLWK